MAKHTVAFDKYGGLEAIGFSDARKALIENAQAISSENDSVAWNTNIALMYLCRMMERTGRDVDLLHNRLEALKIEVENLQSD